MRTKEQTIEPFPLYRVSGEEFHNYAQKMGEKITLFRMATRCVNDTEVEKELLKSCLDQVSKELNLTAHEAGSREAVFTRLWMRNIPPKALRYYVVYSDNRIDMDIQQDVDCAS